MTSTSTSTSDTTSSSIGKVESVNADGTISVSLTGTGTITTGGRGMLTKNTFDTIFKSSETNGERRGYVAISIEMLKKLFKIKPHLEITTAAVDPMSNELRIHVKDTQKIDPTIPLHTEGAQSVRLDWKDVTTHNKENEVIEDIMEPGLQGKMIEELIKKDKQE